MDSRDAKPPAESDDRLASFRERLNRKTANGRRPPQPNGDTSLLRRYDQTPSASAPVQDRAWDSTPSAADRSRVRRTWDATPRSERGEAREWDTPRATLDGRDYPEEQTPSTFGGREWEEEQMKLDREWYASEEGGPAADEDNNPFAEYQDYEKEKEEQLKQKRQTRISSRHAQYAHDNELWETNRLAQSGLGGRRTIDLDFEDEEQSRVHLITHDLKPPFLDGRVTFTKQLEPINPVRDATSDLAIYSKKGSALVREKRAQAEREKATRKVAELGGTNLGNLLGVQEKAEGETDEEMQKRGKSKPSITKLVTFTQGLETVEAEAKAKPKSAAEEHKEARKDSQFASHMKNQTAASHFARSKTLKEQRQYLPAFACREGLLRVIRENQG